LAKIKLDHHKCANTIFTAVPCILMLSKSFIYQLMQLELL